MTAQPGSPNWHWQQLGYTIERMQVIHPRTGKPTEYRQRFIRRPDGSVVEIDQRPEEDALAAEARVAEAEVEQQKLASAMLPTRQAPRADTQPARGRQVRMEFHE